MRGKHDAHYFFCKMYYTFILQFTINTHIIHSMVVWLSLEQSATHVVFVYVCWLYKRTHICTTVIGRQRDLDNINISPTRTIIKKYVAIIFLFKGKNPTYTTNSRALSYYVKKTLWVLRIIYNKKTRCEIEQKKNTYNFYITIAWHCSLEK